MRPKKRASISDFASSLKLAPDDHAALEKAVTLVAGVLEKFELSLDDLKPLVEKEDCFPDCILNENLTVLESVVKYLKEKGNSPVRISKLINRDQRNIWNIYNSAKRKHPDGFVLKRVRYWIPFSVFETSLSTQEALVSYLKDKDLTYHMIAVLLHRDDRTVWTVYKRAMRKIGRE